jgi:ATP-dependent exoDNAse (exonuclease V) alpha subunit
LEGILGEIRAGSISSATMEFFENIVGVRKKRDFTVTKLYTHNIDVDSVNTKELDALEGKEETYQMRTRGKANVLASLMKSVLAPSELRLKENAVVMFVKNNFDEGYVNGTLGKVLRFESGHPVVETFSGKHIYVTYEK